jgi:hypothetical protein
MPVRISVLDQIKKLMGWCPNSKVHETRQHVNLGNFDSNISDRARGENNGLKSLGWLRKMSTYILLIDICFTLGYSLIIGHLGVNLGFLLAGFFIVLLFIILTWNAQIKRYDTLVKQPVVDHSDKEKMYYIFAFVFFLVIFNLYIKSQELALKVTFSFCGGLLIGMWLIYFQLIYWEKINLKTVCFNKIHGMWKRSYLIRERK